MDDGSQNALVHCTKELPIMQLLYVVKVMMIHSEMKKVEQMMMMMILRVKLTKVTMKIAEHAWYPCYHTKICLSKIFHSIKQARRQQHLHCAVV